MLLFQIVGWGIILGLSLMWSSDSNSDSLDMYGLMIFLMNLVVLMFIYLLNYLIFIPYFLFRDRRALFVVFNFFTLTSLLCMSYYSKEAGWFNSYIPQDAKAFRPAHGLMFLARDLINYILMIGLVTAFRLAERLQKSEEALKEAENARVKAELTNLRSQINPHFLLNTLNNIYALTEIDAQKAQKTIKELSDLLRYVLYDNLGDRVSLSGEVRFIKTYIELMSIRLPRRVEIKTEFRIEENSPSMIAPLLFISLIENAFKHSVSASGEGFIDICFEDIVDRGEVYLSITNSNNAKLPEDKSGHGIGLEQVARRLELQYPGEYSWDVTSDEKQYRSTLILKSL
ncbi:MAG: sensor histidine kinase [Rikenellaceae bacterium]